MRGHSPIVIENFKGLWSRGNSDVCPPDHGIEYVNCVFSQGGVRSRGLWTLFSSSPTGSQVRRMFIYNNNEGKSFIIAVNTNGTIFTKQILPTDLPHIGWFNGPADMDIDVASFGGRAYIATSTLQGYGGLGLKVFDGTIFRDAGGAAPVGVIGVADAAGPGLIEPGYRYYGVSYETSTGFITKTISVGPSPINITTGKAQLGPLPIGPTGTVARRIIGTKIVSGPTLPANGLELYPSYFIPGGRIADNTTTANIILDYTDTQLIDEASYLQDIYAFPPGGSSITVYHNRLILGATSASRNNVIVSRVNDPETFEIADGTLIIDPSSDVVIKAHNGETLTTGITDLQEYRDTLYVWKLGSTYGIVDNEQAPSTWPITCIDQATGSFRSGVVTVLDSGAIAVEFVMVASKTGLYVFNGMYNYPEISWKVRNYWDNIMKVPDTISPPGSTNIGKINLVSDPVNRVVYCLFGLGLEFGGQPYHIFLCDFSETDVTDAEYFMNVKWARWLPNYGVSPFGLVAFDTGTGAKLLTVNSGDTLLCEYNGTGAPQETPTLDFVTITSNLIRDEVESRVLHIGGYTARALGNGFSNISINGTLVEPVDTTGYNNISKTLSIAPLIVEPLNNKTKTVLTNLLTQQVFLYLSAKYLNLDRLQIWVKPLYKTIPT